MIKLPKTTCIKMQDSNASGEEPSKKRRDFRLDLIRVVAIFLVVFVHSFEACYGALSGRGHARLHSRWRTALGGLAFRCFFMLTGYLVLARDYSAEGAVRGFYRRSYAPLLLTILLWTLIYGAVYVAVGRASMRDVVRWILLLDDVPAGLWWFVPAIISLYAAVPFVSRALSGLSPRALAVPATFVLVYGFAVPTVVRCAPALGVGGSVSSSVTVGYLFGSYGAYIILGYALRRFGWECRTRGARPVAAAVLALSVALGAALVWRGAKLWYDTLPVATGGVALFILLMGSCPRGGGIPRLGPRPRVGVQGLVRSVLLALHPTPRPAVGWASA